MKSNGLRQGETSPAASQTTRNIAKTESTAKTDPNYNAEDPK